MKKFTAVAMAFILMAAMFTACGCMNSAAPTNPGTMPTILPTTQATRPGESDPTMNTTRPAQQHTSPSESSGTMGSDGMNGNNGSTETHIPTETTTPMTRESGRVRSHINGDF